LGLRVKLNFENSDINLDDIAPIIIPENPPQLNPKPIFNFENTKIRKQTLYSCENGMLINSNKNFYKFQLF
jgi:hypothetical protein